MQMRNGGVKPFQKLTREDLSNSPIWEWCVDDEVEDDQDETWVRAVEQEHIPKFEFGQYLVSAKAILTDGSSIPACVEVTVSNGRATFDPLFVFLLDRHLDFVSVETTRLISRYTKTPDNKPSSWELNVMLEGEKKLRKQKIHVSSALARAIALVSSMPHNKK